MALNLNSIFDTIGNITNDSQFQTGIGLMGASRPSDPSMMQAFNVLQAMRENRAAQEKAQADAAYRQAQSEQAREHAKLYGQQVAAQKRKVDMQQRQQEMVTPLIQSALQQFGGGGGMNTPQPSIGGGMQPQSLQAPQIPTAPPSNTFSVADTFVADIEGGYVPNDGGKGPTNFGVNQFANPDVNVRNLTPETASQLRKQRYWDAIGADSLPQPTAMVAYDAAINQGQDYAKKLLEKTGGDPTLMLYQRREDYRKLAASSPLHEKSLKGWESRLNKLADMLKTQDVSSGASGTSYPAPGADPSRALSVAAGAIQATGDDPAEGLKTIAGALKPEVMQPGAFVRDARGNLSRVPNPEDQARLGMERSRLGYEGQRVQQSAQQVQQGERRLNIDERTAQRVQTEATQKMTAARATDFGQVQSVLDSSRQLSEAAEGIYKSPALSRITGPMSLIPNYPGSPAANVKADLEALGSKVLLSTITALKALSANGSTGFGQLSNIEGQHLINSVASLKESQNDVQMRERLAVVIKAANTVQDRAVEVYEKTHGSSPYEGLPVGTRPVRDPKNGAQAKSRNGRPLLKLPDGKMMEVAE